MSKSEIETLRDLAVEARQDRGAAKIGVFNVGFHRYWPQFPGLRERLDRYREEFEEQLRSLGVEVVSAGLVDTVESGRQAGDFLGARHVDLVFCFVTTYVQSAFVLPVAQRSRAQMVLAALQPTAGMDVAAATTYEQLAYDNCTSLPEISYALRAAGFSSNVVFGTLHDDERAWGILRQWVQAAKAAHTLRNARIGLLGHAFEGMLDMNADATAFDGSFGMHIDMLEMCDLKKRVDEASPHDVEAMTAAHPRVLCFPEPGADRIAGPVTPEALDWSARVAVGLERLAADFGLDGIAHYYRGVDGNEYQRLIAGIIVGASLLTARGIPVAGEGDLKNCRRDADDGPHRRGRLVLRVAPGRFPRELCLHRA